MREERRGISVKSQFSFALDIKLLTIHDSLLMIHD